MNIKLTLLIATVAIFITSCATKRYPIAMSPAEASLMTCENHEIEKGQAKGGKRGQVCC